jgi:hypothetical protein
MLTTLQVRTILRNANITPRYTNKTKGHSGNVRRVKAYLPRELSETTKFLILHSLVDLGISLSNIKLLPPSYAANRPSIIITCALA